MVLVMGDCHEFIGYRSPAAMGQCHECCGGARGGRLSVRDQGPVGGLRMVAQRPLREPEWQTSVQSLPLRKPRQSTGIANGGCGNGAKPQMNITKGWWSFLR